jgi:PAS domain S-box-containing protein
MRSLVAVPDAASFGAPRPTGTGPGPRDTLAEEGEESARVGIWYYEYARDLVTWSDEEFRIFGVSPDMFQPTFSNFLELVHPDDRAAMAEANSAAAFGKPMDFGHRIVRPDGEVRHVHERAQVVIRDPISGHQVLIGTTQDITERRSAERSASPQEGSLESLSPRERATLAEILKGASNRETARALSISARTVEYHRANIMRKLNARNIAELVRIVLITG